MLVVNVNAGYEFIYVNFVCNWKNSDACVLEITKFYAKLVGNALKLPRNKININFVFVADDVFGLHQG